MGLWAGKVDLPDYFERQVGQKTVVFQRLHLQQFRCHTDLALLPGPGINVLVGANGTGKTCVLEAIQYLALTKGFRPDREAIQHGQAYFALAADWSRTAEAETPTLLQCTSVQGKGKRILYDRQALPRISDHVGEIPVVAVLPDDTELIKAGGSERRHWLDSLLAQTDRSYLKALIRYDHALRQRNALLASAAETGNLDADQLSLYDPILADAAPKLWEARRVWLLAFLPVFEASYAAIAGITEVPLLGWDSTVQEGGSVYFSQQLARNLPADRAAGRTTWGVHREDLRLTLGAMPVRHYGSQGQQKSFLLALKLAQYHYTVQQTGKQTLLLLDDVCDKLDSQRIRALFEHIHTQVGGQVFVTDTSRERILAAMPDPQHAAARILQIG